MNEFYFRSDRKFAVFDYLISHGQLLLRSNKDDNYKKNIDIIFFDTKYIQIFTPLNGIILRINNNTVIEQRPLISYLGYEKNNLFEVKSGEEKYYIGASFVRIFENELEFNETSLGFENKGRDKELLASA